MQLSLEKGDERKNKMDSFNPSYQSMNYNRFINSFRIFFICFKMFIMQQKKQLRLGSEKNGEWKPVALQLRLSLASQLCVFDDRTNLNWKWVKKLKVWFCCPNYLVYLSRYRSVMLRRHAIYLMIWCVQSECVMP